MSKSLTSELLNHYYQPQTTIARCLRIERRDGVMIALTDHDADLMIDEICYQSAVGYTPTAVSMQDRGVVNTIDVEGILSVAGVSREDIAAGLFDHAQIFIFEVNYEAISQGILPLMSGFWGECQLHNNHYVTEFKSLSQVLQQTVGELYSTHCRAQLGDKRCGLNLAEFALEGVVATIENHGQFTAEGFNQPFNYFQYGLITWQQGSNAGLSMEIQSFQSGKQQNENAEETLCGEFQLVQPMPYPIEVDDIFLLTPGCDKSLAMCKARFNNVVNFRGEPFIPGIDQMLKTP
jgi:uncharacterized phage protein (TIGR02218 family)